MSRAARRLGAACALHAATAAAAEPDTAACIGAYEHAQELRLANRLREAKGELHACAQASCPEPLRGDCVKWGGEVEAQLPTLLFVARDPKGGDVVRVRVLLDGVEVARSIDGRAVAVDPGPHRVRFEPERGSPVELELVAQPGEHDRAVRVVIEPPAPATGAAAAPPLAAEARGVPWPAIVLGGAGLALLGAGAYVGISTENDVSDLRERCAPQCDESDVDAARGRLLLADVLMASGIVAAGAGAWIYLASRPQPAETTAAAPRATAGAAGIGVGVLPGGALLRFGRSF